MGLLKDNQYKTRFPSSVEYLSEVERITNEIAREVGFSESNVDDLSIAVTELFNNAVHHGNKNDVNKEVSMGFCCRDDVLLITVADEGSGFRPEKIDDPLAPENLLSDSGRGIYLVRMLMDRIHFHFTENGSKIVIEKNIS